ncbi:RDD family protein [Corynebacterium kalinowskii]|uniref:RDD family protein n=1 Tax=Corynebacterium kalinowskii TaxID=2675216 RepID=A0A6B8VEG3_9CORY|nr:RDD family protein [Corynebacterium kalinowskii]
MGYFVDIWTVGIVRTLVLYFTSDTLLWDAPAISSLSFYAYKVVLETLWGTTIGKLGLKVIPDRYPALITAVIRNSWLLLPGLVMLLNESIGQIVGTVTLLLLIATLYKSQDRRSIFDEWAGARVIVGRK